MSLSNNDWLKLLRLINDGARFNQVKHRLVFFTLGREPLYRCILLDRRNVSYVAPDVPGADALLHLAVKYSPYTKVFIKTSIGLFTLNQKLTQWVKVRPFSHIVEAADTSGMTLEEALLAAESFLINPC
jgi:hypothetical protein